MRILFVLMTVVSLGAGGCASTPGTGQGGARDYISSEELREVDTSSQTLDLLIQRLRPWWLQSRASTIMGDRILPVVYIDGARFGELEVLSSVPVHEVEDVRFLSAGDATTRYGTGHTGGVILIRSRR